MRKLFVSQPMNGLNNEEILKARNAAILAAEDKYCHVFDVIDSFFENAPVNSRPLWYLGESLKKLAEADVAIFAHGWQKSRGCKIEHEAAVAYGIEVLYE